MPPEDSSILEKIRENAERIGRDVGHATRGDFDRVSPETINDLAKAVKDHMEGRSSVEIPVNERVTIGGRKESDGTIAVDIKVNF
jgi:hypothetical protein